MNEKQQRIEIAEACGWKTTECTVCGVPGHVAINADGQTFYEEASYLKSAALLRVIPDYLHNLNAMAEAEETLDASQCAELARQLKEHHPTYCLTENEQEGEERDYQDFILCHATASQRAEAFLRTIGKWRDEA